MPDIPTQGAPPAQVVSTAQDLTTTTTVPYKMQRVVSGAKGPELKIVSIDYVVTYSPLLVRDLLAAGGDGLVLMQIAMKKIDQVADDRGVILMPKELPVGVMQRIVTLMQE